MLIFLVWIRTSITWQQDLGCCHKSGSQCLIYWPAIYYCHDLLYFQIGLPNLPCAIYPNGTHDIWPAFSTAPESGWIMLCSHFELQNVYMATGFRWTSKSLLTNDSKPFAVSFSKLDPGYSSWDRPARELVMLLIKCHYHLLVINNYNQEHQWNVIVIINNATDIPLKQFLIKDTTTPTSEVSFALKLQRDRIHLGNIVCLTNDVFDDFYLLRRLHWMNV